MSIKDELLKAVMELDEVVASADRSRSVILKIANELGFGDDMGFYEEDKTTKPNKIKPKFESYEYVIRCEHDLKPLIYLRPKPIKKIGWEKWWTKDVKQAKTFENKDQSEDLIPDGAEDSIPSGYGVANMVKIKHN